MIDKSDTRSYQVLDKGFVALDAKCSDDVSTVHSDDQQILRREL